MASRAKPGVDRETPIIMRLRSFKRKNYANPESTSGPSGHLAATNRLDIHVISPLQRQLVDRAAASQGHALCVAEERKIAAHLGACRFVGASFIPLVVETLGGWSKKAINTISRIGHLLGNRLGIPPWKTTRHLFQRLSISLWKGNATLSWMHQIPTPLATVDGVM